MNYRLTCFLRTALCVCGWGCLASCQPSEIPVRAAGGPLPQEMYVWQRVWTPAVVAGIRTAQDRVAGFCVLAGEVVWRGKSPELVAPKLDYALLAAQSHAPGLAFRIGPYAGPFAADDETTKTLLSFAQDCLAKARQGGWEPSELQLDFDAATSKLPGYHTWLKALRKAVAPLPVSFTVLPDWLRSEELKAMAALTQNFVLQVHGIERARVDDPQPQLLSAATVRRWVAQADTLGVPFRVALPTYRTTVGFNAESKIIGLDSEGPARAWPTGTRLVTYVSPAAELARLVQDWTEHRPENLLGLLWYRLPVAGEQRNWNWATLTPVMEGRIPNSKMEISQQGDNPLDLAIINSGESEMPWPAEIQITLPTDGTSISAGDALAGYTLELTPAQRPEATFRRVAECAHQLLPPRGKKPLGWLRMNPSTTSQATHALTIQFH